MRHYNIPIFIPEESCPRKCIYCNQRAISGSVRSPQPNEVIEKIEAYLQTIPRKGNEIEIAFFGGSFTAIPQEKQKEYLSLVQPYLTSGQVDSIRISTRPDAISSEILDTLYAYGVRAIELGSQSFDNDVLLLNKRGHTVEQTIAAARLIKQRGFELGLQMMIGMLGDSKEKTLHTAQTIIDLQADTTRIYPLLVIKHTELAHLYQAGKYIPLSLNEAVEQTAEIYTMLEAAGVRILKTGLHPSADLREGGELLAGPFHVSFRELVLSCIWKHILEKEVGNQQGKRVRIEVASPEINYAVGYGASNRKWLQNRFENVLFRTNDQLKNRSVKVEIEP